MKAKVVASASNPTFKELRKLLNTRGIQEQQLALVAGDKVVPEVVIRHGERISLWITDESGEAPPLAVPWLKLEKNLYAELDQFGTGGPLAVVRVPKFAAWSATAEWPEGCTLFLAMQNPDNVGAVVRSAVAFGVARIVLLKEAAHPFHPKAMRAAGTSLLMAEFQKGPAIKDLDTGEVPLLALDAGGGSLGGAQFPRAFGLLPGVEGPGIPEGLEASKLAIPMQPGVESLNAAVATAIALYAWRTAKPFRK